MLARAARNAPFKRTHKPWHCLCARSRRFSSIVLPPSADDRALLSLFDQPQRTSAVTQTGLFGHSSLRTPEACLVLAQAALHRAELITRRILRAKESRHELRRVVKNLDRLGDTLCSVIDMMELVRHAHPDPDWVSAADRAYEIICEFMNVLNTDIGLYEALKAALSDPATLKSLSPEAHRTALIFRRDFEKSAINLPPEQRRRFVSLSTQISMLGRRFTEEAAAARPPAEIKPSELDGLKDKGLGARLLRQAWATQRDLLIYPGSPQAQMIMRSAPSEAPRRKLYMAANSGTPAQVAVLEELLRARAELARLVGKESFAEMTLEDMMAKSPDNVRHFLDTLMDHTKVHARRALKTLAERKQAQMKSPSLPIIQAWDRDYFCPPEPPAPSIPLPPLTPGTVFVSLSRLFRHLYGIWLRPAEIVPGEVWHPDVQKLEVMHEDEGLIGWIYTDLFLRTGKISGAAHYTVRCSRRTDNDDDASDLMEESTNENYIRYSQEFEAVKRHRIRGQEGVYQLPLVVLLCDFARSGNRPTVLTWHNVLTLYHEMGHAMHSMIGRTEYQTVSGTRCATDFSELPSILMEYFLKSPVVLSLFDIDGSTPVRQVGNHHEDPCHSIDTHSQILMSTIDQVYHSPAVLEPTFNSTMALAELYDSQGLIPYVPGTSFQTQFGHLFGYGATYYSYLFDRAIASRVWREVFFHGPLKRDKGEKLKQDILRFGGGRDPWHMVAALLNAPGLQAGDAGAMREVGRWRLEDEAATPSRH